MKHNCYQCKFRGEVPGSAHSSCKYLPNATAELALYVAHYNGDFANLKLNPHGVKNGWAFWPIDFDPVWVDRCNFFEQKD